MIAAVLVFAAILLGVSVVSPMLLSSRATQMEARVGETETVEAQLSVLITALSSQIAALSSPERVAEQAAQLGMEPAEQVHYVESGSLETEGGTAVARR